MNKKELKKEKQIWKSYSTTKRLTLVSVTICIVIALVFSIWGMYQSIYEWKDTTGIGWHIAGSVFLIITIVGTIVYWLAYRKFGQKIMCWPIASFALLLCIALAINWTITSCSIEGRKTIVKVAHSLFNWATPTTVCSIQLSYIFHNKIK